MSRIIRYINRKIFLILFFIGAISILIYAQDDNNTKVNTCLTCHTEMEYLPEDFMSDNVHISAGLSCTGCHGGDDQIEEGEESMNATLGFIGIPSKSEIPKMCGKCHSSIDYMRTYSPRIATDQVSQYFTSRHGKQLLKGDFNVASCTDCHRAHSIYKSDDPRSSVYPINIPETCNRCHGDSNLMSGYGIPSNQFEKYKVSVHGSALLEKKDISAPTCNDCHGNHGAMPPNISSISHVCGSCHVTNMEYFLQSPMAKDFLENDFHSCEECHGHHDISRVSDKFLGDKENSVCLECHSEGDDAINISRSMYESLTQLNSSCDTIASKIKKIQIIGMNDIEIEYLLKDVRQQVIEARTSIHSFDTSIVLSKTRKGEKIVDKSFELINQEFDEYNNRKNGFLYSTIAFVILAAGIFFKIRSSNAQKT